MNRGAHKAIFLPEELTAVTGFRRRGVIFFSDVTTRQTVGRKRFRQKEKINNDEEYKHNKVRVSIKLFLKRKKYKTISK